jgi:hypothetical protein
MTTRLSAVPTPFVSIPPTTATSFPPEFGLSNLEHDETALPHDEARLHTVKDLATCTTPEMIGNIGPTAAFSLQALLDNSFESIFGVASAYGVNNAPMRFRHLFSKGVLVLDRTLMEIKDEKLRHQSTLDGCHPYQLWQRLSGRLSPSNEASLHAALVALALIMNDTMDWPKKTKLGLHTLGRHNDIIVDASQRRLE